MSDISSEDLNSEDHEDNVAPPNKAFVDNELLERSGVGGGSRFLKKPSNAIATRQSSAPSSQRLSMEEPIRIPQRRSQSAALSRLAQLEERFRHRKEGSYAQTTSPGQPTPQEDPLSAHSSTDLSMKGARFLKKKLTSSVPEQSKQSHVPHIAAKAPPSSVPSKGVSLDSDEEDMERLLGEYLNSSTESPGPKVIQVCKISLLIKPQLIIFDTHGCIFFVLLCYSLTGKVPIRRPLQLCKSQTLSDEGPHYRPLASRPAQYTR